MVGEDCDQLLLVLGLEQCLDGAGGQLRECFVGGREDGERARTVQRVHETGGFHGGDERIELTGAGSDADDGLPFTCGGVVDGQGECSGEGRGDEDEFFQDLVFGFWL
jgi:hypothetical protein